MATGYPFYAGNSCGIFTFEDDDGSPWHDLCSRNTLVLRTFSDYHHFDEHNATIVVYCGAWNDSDNGIFIEDDYDPNRIWIQTGSRLTNEPGYLFGLSCHLQYVWRNKSCLRFWWIF